MNGIIFKNGYNLKRVNNSKLFFGYTYCNKNFIVHYNLLTLVTVFEIGFINNTMRTSYVKNINIKMKGR